MQDHTKTIGQVNEPNAPALLSDAQRVDLAQRVNKVSQGVQQIIADMQTAEIDLTDIEAINAQQIRDEEDRLGPIMIWQIWSAFEMLNEFRQIIEHYNSSVNDAAPYMAAARRLGLESSFEEAMGFETLRTTLAAFLPVAASFHGLSIGCEHSIDEETAAFRSDIAHGRIGLLVSEGYSGSELGGHLEAIGPIMKYAKVGDRS